MENIMAKWLSNNYPILSN